MASRFKHEIESILVALKGCAWATNPDVVTVIEEYGRLVDASIRLRHRERKSALQILFSSRAIDSLLEFAVNRDRRRRGVPPINRMTIGQAINEASGLLDPQTKRDLEGTRIYIEQVFSHQILRWNFSSWQPQ
jgi:hypothetical protein